MEALTLLVFSVCLGAVLLRHSTESISLTSFVPAEPVTVDEFSSLWIYCNTSSHGNITWAKKDGDNIVPLSSGANLTFTNITRLQAGCYICTNATIGNATVGNATVGNATVGNATHGNTTWSNAIRIYVRYPPSIEMSGNKTVDEGANLTLFCNATGYPEPNVTWKWPDGNSSAWKKLDIPSVTRSHGGRYTCTASNTMGSDVKETSVNVLYKPIITQSGNVVDSWLHHKITLECRTSGNPVPVVTWLKDGSPQAPPTTTLLSLRTIEMKTADQFGYYTCVAQNSVGQDRHQIWIKRSRFPPSPPEITNNKTELSSMQLTLKWLQPYDGGSNITSYTIWRRKTLRNRTFTGWGNISETRKLEYRVGLSTGKLYGFAVSATNRQGRSGLGPSKNFSVILVTSPADNMNDVIIYACVGGILGIIVIIIIIVIVRRIRRKPKPIQKPESLGGKDAFVLELKKREKSNRYSVLVEPRDETISEEVPDAYQTSYDISRCESDQAIYANVNMACESNEWEIPREHVEIQKVIGKGAFCRVAKAFVDGLGTVAVKMLRDKSSESNRRDLLAEYHLLLQFGPHDNVIKLMGAVTLSDPIMVLFEYVPYGDLLGYLRRSRGLNDAYYKNPDVEPASSLTSKQLLRFARESADGMAFLAQNKIIHRDLAARNVLVGEGEICKITDFGMARDVIHDDIYQRRTRGRLPVKWTAYESLLYGTYTSQSDVWSFGVVLYEIFTIGGCPYPNQDGHRIAAMLKTGYRMPQPTHVDNEIYALMMECWEAEPERRPTFDAISSTIRRLQLLHKELIFLNEYDGSLYANLDDL